MTSSFRPDPKAAALSLSGQEFRAHNWPEGDEAYCKAVSQAERVLKEAEEKVRRLEQEATEKGLEEGRRRGLEDSRQRIEPLIKALGDVCSDFQESRRACLWEAERALVSLALSIARCILRRETSTSTEVVREMVTHALKEVDSNDILSIHLHPEDWDIMNETGLVGQDAVLALPRGVQVVRDDSVGRGGCLISSDICSIDGRLDEQLATLMDRFYDESERHRPTAQE